MKLSPQYPTAAINLADLYRQLGRDSDGERALRDALVVAPRDAGLHHVLGLTMTRLKRPDDALAEFRRAAELEPGELRYQYVYAIALHSIGRAPEAIALLKDALKNHPATPEILSALISFSRLDRMASMLDRAAALGYAEQLAVIAPDDRNSAMLMESPAC